MKNNKDTVIDMSDIRLRSIVDNDNAFLLRLYESTRTSEMALVEWSEEQKKQFINMQFYAQKVHYFKHYPEATFDVIEFKHQSVGRLYVEEWKNEVRIIDIALLPSFCNQGIGTYLLNRLQAKASSSNKSVSIHVEKNNPAMRLYKRLGFMKTDEQGIYDLLKWSSL